MLSKFLVCFVKEKNNFKVPTCFFENTSKTNKDCSQSHIRIYILLLNVLLLRFCLLSSFPCLTLLHFLIFFSFLSFSVASSYPSSFLSIYLSFPFPSTFSLLISILILLSKIIVDLFSSVFHLSHYCPRFLFSPQFSSFFKCPPSHPMLFCRLSLCLILLSYSLLIPSTVSPFPSFSVSFPLSFIIPTLESDSCCSANDDWHV